MHFFNTVKRYQFRWFGHLARLWEESLWRQILFVSVWTKQTSSLRDWQLLHYSLGPDIKYYQLLNLHYFLRVLHNKYAFQTAYVYDGKRKFIKYCFTLSECATNVKYGFIVVRILEGRIEAAEIWTMLQA